MHNKPRRDRHPGNSTILLARQQFSAAEILETRMLLSGSAPVLSAAGITPNEVLLQWTAPATPPQDVAVERRQGDSAFATIATLPADAISFSDSNLPLVATFQYRIRMDAADGTGAYSNVADATTLPPRLSTTIQQQPPVTLQASTSLTPLAAGNGLAYFAERAYGAQLQLVRTDGTAGGTFAIGNVVPGSQPGSALAIGGTFYFASGNHLWKSNGTISGTEILATVSLPGPSPQVQSLTAFEGSVYFAANSPGFGAQLWKTDGTPAGTTLVKDFGANVVLKDLAATTGGLFLNVFNLLPETNTLWTSDGTDAGTVSMSTPAPATMFGAGNRLYFTTASGQLWATDANGRATELMDSGVPTDGSAQFCALGSTVFFLASDAGGVKLWSTDGTPANTQSIFAFPQSVTAASAVQVAAEDGKLFFAAPAAAQAQTNTWASDGTASGTTLLQTFTGVYTAQPDFTAAGSTVFFSAFDNNGGAQLWKSDGTPAGTVPVGRFAQTPASTTAGEPRGLLSIGDRVVFSADDGVHGRELWASDGTPAGTQMLADASYVVHPAHPDWLTSVGSRVLFTASPSINGFPPDTSSVWSSDGTPQGTVELYPNLVPGLFAANGAAYFAAEIGAVATLMRTDGTPAGTVPVTALGGSEPTSLVFYGATAGQFFFSLGGTFVSDGTAAGTHDLYLGPGPIAGVDGSNPVGGKPYAVASDGLYYLAQSSRTSLTFELWRSDGTQTGTMKVAARTGTTMLEPHDLVASGGRLFFEADNPFLANAPHQLWSYDRGSQAMQSLHDFTFLGKIVDVSGNAYFFAEDGASGIKLWKSDGTAQGTVPVLNLSGGWIPPLLAPDGSLYLVGFSPNHVGTLYRSDGTDAGTVPLHTAAGDFGSLWIAGNTVLFRDGSTLWATGGTPLTTRQVDDAYFAIPMGFTFQDSSAVAVGNRFYYVPVPPTSGTAGELRDLSLAPLGAPSSITAQVSSAAFEQGLPDVTLNWADDSPDASGFLIERSTHPDFSTIDASFYAPAPSTRFVDSAPSGAAVYYYRLLATNAAGDSQPSEPAAAVFSAVSGIVFSDANNDGRQEAGELGMSGVTVYVDLNGNGRLDPSDVQTTTDASGAYLLGGLPPGNYLVHEVVPAGYARTTPGTNSAAVQTSTGQMVAGATFGNVAISGVPMNFDYLLVLAQHYGQPGTFATGDVNGDDVVDFADLLAVAQNYGHPIGAATADDASVVIIKTRTKPRAVHRV